MRRLEILLVGRSQVLDELTQELEQQGHLARRLDTPQAVDAGLPTAPDLLIEDGSLALPVHIDDAVQLGLRVEYGPLTAAGLPALALRCWQEGRLIERRPVDQDGSGNGQALRLAAAAALLELCTLLVSRFARDADYFRDIPPVAALPWDAQHPLPVLESLAFEHRFNQTARPDLLALAAIPVLQRIEDSLRRFAERPALTFNGNSSSYRQLHAHGLAIQECLLAALAGLDTRGTAPVIGVCLDKTPALYATLLAILGCAAIYLPLDPSHPRQRQRFILEDAGAVLLLHEGRPPLDDHLPSLDIRAVQIDHAAPSSSSLLRQVSAAQAPCLAFYTSGTSGQPKGVLLSQANLAHFTAWYADYVQLSEHSRVLQFSTLSFDASLIDIFPSLVQGAELVVASEDQRRDPLQLATLIRRQRISHAFLPPMLLGILPLDPPLGLSHVMTGGDVCEPWVIEQLTRQARFYNLYGPTEATVLVTARQFRSGTSNRSLGRPIANSQVFILDEHGQPVAEQTLGELYIAGPGVGLGYLNNPGKTAECYVPLYTGDGSVQRVYRTGDLAQWTAEGIELCGRRDHQVKIRGFRVEPGEIEHCLRNSRLYRQVAVIIDNWRRILAYMAQPITADSGRDALRQHVERCLPGYMHPAAYVELAELPSAGNGKVDRHALLELPVHLPDASRLRLPANADEAWLLGLWAKLLELPVDEISTDESFFNLGGHSILLSKLLLGIREHYGHGISINRFIEEPTLCRLAVLVRGESTQEAVSPRVFIDAVRQLDFQALPAARAGDPGKVVLTGANSFVGVHIVEALLAAGVSEIACLVRDSTTTPAAERFARALRDNRLEHLDLNRVRVYPADIRQPRLGLAVQVHERIDREFGVLIHNAAHVNHVLDYETLAADNVDPLFECLRLCEGRSKKVFNFISSLSACSRIAEDGRVLEQLPADTPPIYIRNGYNLSKWVGERILQRAYEQGAWVNLYRPGNISFNSRNGVCQPQRNRLLLMLKGSLQLGQVPALALNFDLMPVDFLARFIAFESRRVPDSPGVFNLHNPQPLSWNDYVAAFREAGHDFQLVSVADWQRQLQRVDRDNALFEVLGFYLNGFEEDIGDISAIEHDQAEAGIRRMGDAYPYKTPALLRKGCDYLRQIRFI
ncbi:amino acid adenylation domain-containing protein [Pseudomonas gingeri]|uniref:Non-ribosomal peptide synthetase n=1 Tax=Pseudomonas gingeri TaxID=117681 RepID=A0A7Y7Y6Z0_9PSED|nr:amino acid adenylation domain-containing protein [Pseudomonas gingeri]NWB31718.1 non-ribosomal peptide synthetase [Pseudomonas gingeri]NWC30992.1 non-ribosomal peptide synthetase [Pseudomonas gingeri]NWD50753.1 non-ribosomal peptide synthetase [Pseudomonas gingeri]